MSTTVEHVTLITRITAFRDGFTQGRQGFYRAINISNRVQQDVIVDVVRNLTENVVRASYPCGDTHQLHKPNLDWEAL